jgi:hypothetical protein
LLPELATNRQKKLTQKPKERLQRRCCSEWLSNVLRLLNDSKSRDLVLRLLNASKS